MFHLLIVNSNSAALERAVEATKEAGLSCRISTANDGEGAIEHAHRAEDRPDLILVHEITLAPRGCKIVTQLKTDRCTQAIPVIVLGASSAITDVNHAYDCQANCFITEPSSFEDYVDLMRVMGAFWMRSAVLPAAAHRWIAGAEP